MNGAIRLSNNSTVSGFDITGSFNADVAANETAEFTIRNNVIRLASSTGIFPAVPPPRINLSGVGRIRAEITGNIILGVEKDTDTGSVPVGIKIAGPPPMGFTPLQPAVRPHFEGRIENNVIQSLSGGIHANVADFNGVIAGNRLTNIGDDGGVNLNMSQFNGNIERNIFVKNQSRNADLQLSFGAAEESSITNNLFVNGISTEAIITNGGTQNANIVFTGNTTTGPGSISSDCDFNFWTSGPSQITLFPRNETSNTYTGRNAGRVGAVDNSFVQ